MRRAFDDRAVGGGAPQPHGNPVVQERTAPPGALPHTTEKDTMTSRLPHLCLAVGLLVALALPSAALAHGGGHHDRSRICRAVENNRVPRGLTAAQAQSLATACTTRANAVKAADDAFVAAAKPARDAYRAAVAPLTTQLRTAFTAKRTACRADRSAQACTDARAAYRSARTTLAPQFRAAREALRTAVRPAAQIRAAAVRAAQQAFRASVRQILGA
jgi:hypothetical protein